MTSTKIIKYKLKEIKTMSLRESAIKTTTLSELMNGRTKQDTDKLVGKKITILRCDIVYTDSDRKEWYPIFTYAEDDTKFFNGGAVMKNIVTGWLEEMESIDAINEELANMGGLMIKMTKGKTKKGRDITNVEIM